MKEDIIVIVGPTAVGKTALGIELAKQFNTEIISGDSVQVYEGLNIGSGKVTKEEANGIPHAMIDIIKPSEDFSVADFQTKVRDAITAIHEKGKIPIIVGGSGLYIQAILFPYKFTENRRNEVLTKTLENRARNEGSKVLYEELTQVDPIQAKKIHPNNVRRVIRALEHYYDTGTKISDKVEAEQQKPLYNHYIIGLEMDRTHLYHQINQRVDQMLEDGLIEEVTMLYNQYGKDVQAMRAIGYKEIIPYLEGTIDLHTAVEQLKQNSRRFAKRQFTWFKNKLDVHWYTMEPNNKDAVYEQVVIDLQNSLQI